jgi:hypothetical protein
MLQGSWQRAVASDTLGPFREKDGVAWRALENGGGGAMRGIFRFPLVTVAILVAALVGGHPNEAWAPKPEADSGEVIRVGAVISFGDNVVGAGALLFAVPIGKRLIIEHVSILMRLPPGQLPIPSIDINGPSGGEIHVFTLTPTFLGLGTDGRDIWTVGQQVQMHADQGMNVVADLNRSGGTFEAVPNAAGFKVLGRLVNAP